MARKAGDIISTRLRLPAGLHRMLVASAKDNNRSLNSEVLWALAQYLGEDAQKHVEAMRVERQRVMENVIRKLFTDPQRVERLIAKMGKEDN